ncbi:MAG: hypothetical protein IT200_08200 [Thermoleophilia bacterium]|nr:hypothetical protein [Thermoleophilia bacterium]
MPIIALPAVPPALFQPPAAYIESPHTLRRMNADFGGRWCLPVAELPPTAVVPAGATILCAVASTAMTAYGRCVQRMGLLPEVPARPGEQVRFHVPEGIGTPVLTIARADAVEGRPSPIGPWTATPRVADDPPALVRITASSERGDVTYAARVVVSDDLTAPAVRVNVRRAARVFEITPTPGSSVVACVEGRGASTVEPVRRRTADGTMRVAFDGARVVRATVAVRGPNGVRTIARIAPR